MGKNFTFEEMNMTLEMIRDWNTEENWERVRSKIITERDNRFLVQAVYDVINIIEEYIYESKIGFDYEESDFADLMLYLTETFKDKQLSLIKNLQDYDNKNEPIQIFKTAWFYTTNTLFGE